MNNESLTSIELENFEQLIFSGDFFRASIYLHQLLILLGEGSKPLISLIDAGGVPGNLTSLLTRLCSAIGQTIVHPEFQTSIPNLETLMSYQSILSKMFALTPFISTDYLVKNLILVDENGVIPSANILKAYLLLSTESKLTEHLHDIGWQNPDLHATTCLMMIWACTGSEQSCANREWAYDELNSLLDEKTTLSLPLGVINGFFMHSSYGFSQHKHVLKKRINQIIQKSLPAYDGNISNANMSSKLLDIVGAKPKATHHQKPVLLIILEHFNQLHAVYRVLGKSMQACKEHFTLVSVAWPDYVKDLPKDFFDIEITLSGTGENYCLDELFGIVNQYRPVAVYYPSIGMKPWTIYFSNVRLAPVQFVAVGHGASSFATEIDYFLIEEDIAGDPDTYSEKLIRLPIGSMPFYYPIGIEYHPRNLLDSTSLNQDAIQIACCSSFMKLNTHLLHLCQRLDQKYRSRPNGKSVVFNFFLQIYSIGIDVEIYRQLILRYLPNAIIHTGLSFQSYLDKLALMDISLSPFPFGGMNGIIDCATLGVVGVCMQGAQVHEAFDAGMMRRMSMPDWLIANNAQQYESAVCRLIDNDAERLAIRGDLIRNKNYQSFFNGDASVFANYVRQMILGDIT